MTDHLKKKKKKKERDRNNAPGFVCSRPVAAVNR
jgi:hypothetical protein